MSANSFTPKNLENIEKFRKHMLIEVEEEIETRDDNPSNDPITKMYQSNLSDAEMFASSVIGFETIGSISDEKNEEVHFGELSNLNEQEE
jgi:hypothetical protein